LALFAEEQHVVAGDQRDVDLGNDRFLIAHNARKKFLAAREGGQKIVPQFLLDRFRGPAAVREILERRRFGGHAMARTVVTAPKYSGGVGDGQKPVYDASL